MKHLRHRIIGDGRFEGELHGFPFEGLVYRGMSGLIAHWTTGAEDGQIADIERVLGFMLGKRVSLMLSNVVTQYGHWSAFVMRGK